MTRYLQNWIQSILISKSDFLRQALSVVLGASLQCQALVISLKIIFLFNSIYFALQTTYKYVPYINQIRIISRSRRYLQIWPTTFTFPATVVQTGLINLGTVLICTVCSKSIIYNQ